MRKSAGLAVYFEPKNVFPQCFACNIWRDGNTDEYALFLIRKFGPTILEELNALKSKIVKLDYPLLIEEWTRKLNKLNERTMS